MIEFVVYQASQERVADRVNGALAHDPQEPAWEPGSVRRGETPRRQIGHALRRLSERLEARSRAQAAPADGR
jgi:hypothetical protein